MHMISASGHAKAYDFMFTLLKNRTITEKDVLTMHRMFYENIESEYAGKYRGVDVFIRRSFAKRVVCDEFLLGYAGMLELPENS